MGRISEFFKRVSRRLREIRVHMRAERVDEIARRYLVMNAFDGALAILSVIVSAYFVGSAEPKLIVAVGLASCMAMGISGFTGTFLTEKAERTRRLKELESVLLVDLSESDFNTVSTLGSIYVAFIDGVAPMISGVVSLLPIMMAMIFPIQVDLAIYIAIGVNLATLFILGAFLGRISRSNLVVYGLKMMAIGILTAFLCILLRAF